MRVLLTGVLFAMLLAGCSGRMPGVPWCASFGEPGVQEMRCSDDNAQSVALLRCPSFSSGVPLHAACVGDDSRGYMPVADCYCLIDGHAPDGGATADH